MPAIYEDIIIGVDGREGGLDAAALAATPAPVDSAAVARWQERHPEPGVQGTR